MKKVALVIIIITGFSKILGFFRDVTLSYHFGASQISDAYLISLTIPMILFSFIATGINTSFIPMYNNIYKEKGPEGAEGFTNNLINIIIVLCSIISLITMIFTEPIVKVFASGFEGKTLDIAIEFTRISVFGVFFSGIICIIAGYLNVKNSFIVPSLMGLPFNLAIISSILIGAKMDIPIFLPLGSVLAVAFQLLFILVFAARMGFRYQFTFDLRNGYMKKMAFLSIPVMIGVSVDQINVFVDKTIASHMSTGAISSLNYANTLILFVQGLFAVPIATVIYPEMSRMALELNIEGLKESLKNAIVGVMIVIIPCALIFLFFSNPIVSMLFGRGAFDEQAVMMTSGALFYYSFGLIGYGVREILLRAFYSLQDTRTPMINAAVAMLMNIMLLLILSHYLGINGLALATSISALLCSVLLLISLSRKIGKFGTRKLVVAISKICFSALLMALVSKLAFHEIHNYTNSNVALILTMVLAIVMYGLLLTLVRLKEFIDFMEEIKNKLKVLA